MTTVSGWPGWRVAVSFLAGVLCGSAACDGRPDAAVRPVYDRGTGQLVELLYDSNGDGRPDVRTFLDAGRPTRSEIDHDEDGVVERWEYYDKAGLLEKVGTSSANDGQVDTWTFSDGQGGIGRIERSTARDGRVTRWEYFQGQQLQRAEEDVNGDGSLDQWESYEGGALVELSLDTTFQRGRPDRRLTYAPDGSLLRVEIDPEGDGSFTAAPSSGRDVR